MSLERGGTKCATALLFGLIALGLSGCDPGHPFEDVQVKIFSNGDGRATMSAEVHAVAADGARVDESAFLDALARELAIGEPDGPAVDPPDRNLPGPAIQLAGVDQGQLTVSLATVLEVMDAGERTLRAWVRRERIGTLEIKKRGIDIDPAALRRRLKPAGPASATVVLTPTVDGARALVAQRL